MCTYSNHTEFGAMQAGTERYLGWPDLLSWRSTLKGPSDLLFAEVKSSSDKLSEDQRSWIEGNAARLKFPFHVVKVRRTGRLTASRAVLAFTGPVGQSDERKSASTVQQRPRFFESLHVGFADGVGDLRHCMRQAERGNRLARAVHLEFTENVQVAAGQRLGSGDEALFRVGRQDVVGDLPRLQAIARPPLCHLVDGRPHLRIVQLQPEVGGYAQNDGLFADPHLRLPRGAEIRALILDDGLA